MKYNDKDIIKSIRTGQDRKALEALYKDLFPKIKKLVTGADRAEEAKDIFQEAMLIFYKQVIAGKFDEKYEVAGFIYTVSKNLWINRLTKKKRQVTISPKETGGIEEINILNEMLVKDKKELIKKIFSGLGDKCRELLTYTIYQDLKMEDVAGKMGFNSANAATTAAFRCKEKLMQIIKDNKVEEQLRE